MTGDDLFGMLNENLSIIVPILWKTALFAFVCLVGKAKENIKIRKNELVLSDFSIRTSQWLNCI